MVLKEDFYTRPATDLAPLLLGKLLCRRVGIDYAAKADRDRPWRYLVK